MRHLVVLATVLAGALALAGSASPSVGRTTCPVTLPNGAVPPGTGSTRNGYRHGALWVQLWPDGVTLGGEDDVRSDGRLAIKVPWYRYVRGKLRISGSRLDAPAPKLHAWVPDGWPRGFQASGVYLPSEGCWRIVGTLGHTRLAFVTIVMTTRTVREEVPRG